MDELFVIKDYDTGEAIEIIITNDAYSCQEVMSEFEDACLEDEDLEFEDFFKMLKKHKEIKFKRASIIVKYDY